MAYEENSGFLGKAVNKVKQNFTELGQAAGAALTSVTNYTTDTEANFNRNPWIPNLNSGNYNFQTLKFPQDIDSPEAGYHGHSMLININVVNYSPYARTSYNNSPVSIYNGQAFGIPTNGSTSNYTMRQNQYSRLETLRRGVDPQIRGTNGVLTSEGTQGITLTARRTRRITEAVLLYMPSTVNFVTQNMYQDHSLMDTMSGMAGGAARAIGSPAAAAVEAVSNGTSIAGKLNNTPINPRVEVLFQNTAVRGFDFTFMFAPSNEKESLMLENIIRTLRFHAHSEIGNNGIRNMGFGLGGIVDPFFLTAPSEFDITFFHDGKENTKIPRVNTCVLENIDVDYAPTGAYATFNNGHSVFVRVTLRFRETNILDKKRIIQGF